MTDEQMPTDPTHGSTDADVGANPRPTRERARTHLSFLRELATEPPRLLVVDEPGLTLSKHSERLRQGVMEREVAVVNLEHVLIVGRGIALSSDVVALCAEREIALDFLSPQDDLQVALMPASWGATVQTRRQQLAAYGDERGVAVTCSLVAGKLANQARLLRYMAKNRRTRAPAVYAQVMAAARIVEGCVRQVKRCIGATADDVRPAVITIEGHAGKVYWQSFGHLLLDSIEWYGRETCGARDPVNSALNYAYRLLYVEVQRAVMLAGLDPYGGFLHVDRARQAWCLT